LVSTRGGRLLVESALCRRLIVSCAVALMGVCAGQSQSVFPRDEMAKGIAYGKQFATQKQLIEVGLKKNKIELSSYWSKDGIQKEVVFYKDYHVVAVRVAEATQQLREVSEKDLSNIPYTGLLFAHLELRARGTFPIRHLNQRFTDGSTHMVLQIDGANIQPAKEGFFPRPEKQTCVGQYYSYSIFAIHNFAIGVGGPDRVTWDCTQRTDRFNLEFGFHLTPDQQRKQGTVIVANSEGERFVASIDLSAIQ
jgi:hypothetical protein